MFRGDFGRTRIASARIYFPTRIAFEMTFPDCSRFVRLSGGKKKKWFPLPRRPGTAIRVNKILLMFNVKKETRPTELFVRSGYENILKILSFAVSWTNRIFRRPDLFERPRYRTAVTNRNRKIKPFERTIISNCSYSRYWIVIVMIIIHANKQPTQYSSSLNNEDNL